MVEVRMNQYPVAMFRFSNFISQSFKQRDWFALLLLTFMLGIAAWIVAMPFSSTVRQHAIRRFHVASPSFQVWAAMAPVPAMYNFENRAQFSNELIGEGPFDEDHESWFSLQLNHFPARIFTFGEMTSKCFRDHRQGTLEMSTRYRETELTSRWEIQEQPDGSMHVQRLAEDWVQHDAKK
jgi:hypothetical protein